MVIDSREIVTVFLIDLLHKSGFEFEFQIVDGSHQIKTESQTSSSLAITPAPNSTDL
jgi:hypothetical protein